LQARQLLGADVPFELFPLDWLGHRAIKLSNDTKVKKYIDLAKSCV
jgi:hypothetical protein